MVTNRELMVSSRYCCSGGTSFGSTYRMCSKICIGKWPCLCIVYIYKHSTDIMKTRVQASTISFPEMIAKLPEVS
nr:mitochondrial substrate carrier family protein C [Tanacetum cinerariifolium]